MIYLSMYPEKLYNNTNYWRLSRKN